MEKYIGIWLDHKKAVIVSIIGTSEEKHIIESQVQTRRRIAGEGKAYTRIGKAFIAPERRQEERVKHELDKYYNAICRYIHDASAILIFGPGEAKTELEKVISLNKSFDGKVQKVEVADRLTQNQIAARVREFVAKLRFFQNPFANPFAD